MNISSIVVQVNRENYDKLTELLKESELCDYHFGDKEKGKIIITIEGKDVSEEIEKLVKIQAMPRVIAADMMQTYQEDMLNEEIDKLNEEDPVLRCSMMIRSMPKISSIMEISRRKISQV